LGVHIHNEDALSKLGERRSQVDGCGGFTDAPFLVGDGDHPAH
jgi:hypothetical protein